MPLDWPPEGRNLCWSPKNRTNRIIYANRPEFVIVLLSHPAVPMLACIPKPYSPWLIPNTGYEETQAVAKTKTSTKTKISARGTGKVASRKAKGSIAQPSTKKGSSAGGKSPVSDKEVTIDRRRSPRRDDEKEAAKPAAPPVKLERRAKVNRRRQIDPTTCERDYTDDEVEFMNALDDYKRKNGRMFPTCSEVLEVVRSLGYVRLTPTELALRTPVATTAPVEVAVSEEEEFESATDWQ